MTFTDFLLTLAVRLLTEALPIGLAMYLAVRFAGIHVASKLGLFQPHGNLKEIKRTGTDRD